MTKEEKSFTEGTAENTFPSSALENNLTNASKRTATQPV